MCIDLFVLLERLAVVSVDTPPQVSNITMKLTSTPLELYIKTGKLFRLVSPFSVACVQNYKPHCVTTFNEILDLNRLPILQVCRYCSCYTYKT